VSEKRQRNSQQQQQQKKKGMTSLPTDEKKIYMQGVNTHITHRIVLQKKLFLIDSY